MTKFIGNCAHLIDWVEFSEKLDKKNPGIKKFGRPVNWVNKELLDPNFPESADVKKYLEITSSKLDKANFNFSSTLWYVYRIHEHFDEDVLHIVCNYLKIEPLSANAYRVDPGCNCPLHIDPQEEDSRERIRYTWQISPTSFGQILLVEDQALHNLNIGDIYQWNDHRSMHGATNCGLLPVYYFLVEGIKK